MTLRQIRLICNLRPQWWRLHLASCLYRHLSRHSHKAPHYVCFTSWNWKKKKTQEKCRRSGKYYLYSIRKHATTPPLLVKFRSVGLFNFGLLPMLRLYTNAEREGGERERDSKDQAWWEVVHPFQMLLQILQHFLLVPSHLDFEKTQHYPQRDGHVYINELQRRNCCLHLENSISSYTTLPNSDYKLTNWTMGFTRLSMEVTHALTVSCQDEKKTKLSWDRTRTMGAIETPVLIHRTSKLQVTRPNK